MSQNLYGKQGTWERIIGRKDLVWPDSDVIRCTNRFFGAVPPEERAQLHACDMGFGTGQHIVYLASEGFNVAGIDVADSAIQQTRQKLDAAQLTADIRQEELSLTTFADASFDYLIAWGVLFLKPTLEIQADLKRIHALMKPGGIVCANFRTRKNWFYGLGEEKDTHTYLLDDRAREYEGTFYRFFDKEELQHVLEEAGFEVVYLEYKEWHKYGTEVHSWWLTNLRIPTNSDT